MENPVPQVKVKKRGKWNIHFLRDFLLNPKSFPGFLHDEIDNLHNASIAIAQEYRQQNVGHNQEKAVEIENKIDQVQVKC